MNLSPILRNFDHAASRYDKAAQAQAIIAERLVAWAAEGGMLPPTSILDIGSGTGLVSVAAHQHWPEAKLAALDGSAAMLQAAQQKLPQLTIYKDDILQAGITQKFDALFCSMALHWLPDPRAALRRWQSWLQPQGQLFVALPVEGSFQEWRDLCAEHGVKDGLWPLPLAGFADAMATRLAMETITVPYASPHEFLRTMKLTGAATASPRHAPINIPQMRALLRYPRPAFSVSYKLSLLALPAATL